MSSLRLEPSDFVTGLSYFAMNASVSGVLCDADATIVSPVSLSLKALHATDLNES